MRQRILVLISEGGGGHKSAGESLVEILSPHYEIDVVNAVEGILGILDFSSWLSFGKITGDKIYNWLLQNELGPLLRLFVKAGNRYMHDNREKIVKLFDRYLTNLKDKPQLIISTMPFMNHGLLLAANRHKIPFLLLPTDLDVATFLNGFDRLSQEELQRFKMTIAYERPEMLLNVSKNSSLKPEDVIYSGFPIRPACQRQYSTNEIEETKRKLGMALDRHTVTLVMGATGCNAIVDHSNVIARMKGPFNGKNLQVNICVGRNKKSKIKILNQILVGGGAVVCEDEYLTTALSKEGVLIHIRGFTKEIIPILACSDLVISKTGSCTVNEAIYLKKKLLLDNTPQSSARYLRWEEFNINFVKRHRLGGVFTTSEQLSSLIPFMLQNEEQADPSFVLPDFQKNIKKIVADLVSE